MDMLTDLTRALQRLHLALDRIEAQIPPALQTEARRIGGAPGQRWQTMAARYPEEWWIQRLAQGWRQIDELETLQQQIAAGLRQPAIRWPHP